MPQNLISDKSTNSSSNGDGVSIPQPHEFTEPFIQAQIKENFQAPRHWPLRGEVIGG